MRMIFPVALLLVAAPSSPTVASGPAPAAEAPAERGQPEPVHVTLADLPGVMAAVKAPGARAVLVNVWASWCEPCRQEMPELMRFYRENREKGLRLIMVSADDEDQRKAVEQVLNKEGFDGPAYIKHGNDMAFINGLEPRWSGELPSTFLFDGAGNKKRFWAGMIGTRELKSGVAGLLTKGPAAGPSSSPGKTTPRRKP